MNERYLRLFILSILCLAGGMAARAETATDAFESARLAYDTNNVRGAIRLYQQPLAGGRYSAALYFNLGNACYRAGSNALAVLNYRRAWTLAPNDPDIAANLKLVAERAGAVLPTPTIPTIWLQRLNAGQWALVAAAGYGVAFLSLLIMIPARTWRLALRRFLLAGWLALLAGGAGSYWWWQYRQLPDIVIMIPGVMARSAPIPDAATLFKLPEASVVRLVETDRGWLHIADDRRQGWIPAAAGLRVLPLSR